jgi:glycosyltransferase involved in cell wall biosynthesis
MENLKVLFISGIDGDTRRYRCVHHQEQLAFQGVPTALREDNASRLLTDVFDYDLFVLHRVPFSSWIGLIIDLAHAQGKPIVFETDDLVFVPELYAQIGFVDTLSPEAARRFRSDLARLEKTFQNSDCVLTTTEFLAERARQRGKPAYVHRNTPSTEMFNLSEYAWANRQQRLENNDTTSSVIIAYFSGTGSHNRDFQTIAKPLAWVLSNYPQTWLHIGGHLELGTDLKPFQTRIRRTPYVTWRELPQFIAQSDLNLVPLERENPFCQAKSEIKFLEAALVGVPTIASRVEAYEHAISHGHNGFLVNTPDEWRDILQTLIDNPEQRKEIGQKARRTVYTRYSPERQARKIWSTLSKIHRQYHRPAVPKYEIWQTLVNGVKEHVGKLQQETQHQRDQIEDLRRTLRHYENQLIMTERTAEQRITDLEQHIEDIMQGRVMRLMTKLQGWWRRSIRRENRN